MRNPNLSINPVQLARYLFFVAASVLLIFSVGTLLRINQNPDQKVMYLMYAVLFLGDAVLMFICGLFVSRQKRVYWFAVVFLSLNIVLSITDQFGVVDLLFLWFNLIILGILILARKSFLPHETNS
jgi:lysylphosphatidylglycerol synthetase-like protein (DUF2156 family)